MTACSSIQEIDVPICIEINMSEGHCTTIITGKEFPVDDKNLFENKNWFDQSPTMLRLPASSWAKIKAYLLKQCKRYGDCKEVTQSNNNIDELFSGSY